MKDAFGLLVVVCMLIVCARYVYQIAKHQIQPMLSTWLIFLSGTGLSLITYGVAQNHDWKSGILNLIDLINVSLIVAGILIWGDKKVRLKPFEKWYLLVALGIIGFWILSRNAFVSNLLTQVLITWGYLPTIQNLYTSKKNTESFSAWSMVWGIAFLAIYPAINQGNVLAVIYVCRTIAMVGLVLVIMTIVEVKHRRALRV